MSGRLLLSLALVAGAGCRTVAGPTTLERGGVQHLTVETIDAAGEHFVRVSGATQGATAVQRVETRTEDGIVRVRVLMAPAGEGGSGSFSVIVHVPPAIRQVEFGDEQAVVWPIAGVR